MEMIEPVVESENGVEGCESVTVPFSVRATIGYSIVVGLISVAAQVLFIIIWAVVGPLINGGGSWVDIATDGNGLLGAVLFSYPMIFGATYLIVRSRRGLNFWTYIGWEGWRVLPGKALLPWFAALIGSMFLNGLVMKLTGATSSTMMMEVLQSANPALVIATMVFGAPFIEELFFRGFMFKGLENSRVGGVGAIVITTLIWAVIHGGQYNLAEISYLMVIGALLGYARLKTGTICLSLGLHVINNLVAVILALIWGVN